MTESVLIESFQLARQIRNERNLPRRLIRAYWMLCFRSTRWIERLAPPGGARWGEKTILNYGCGNKFYDGAINADLFAPHRFLLAKRRPELYWSGITAPLSLRQRLVGVVCEHVIEHILPDDVSTLLKSFRAVLMPGGCVVISFPDVSKVLLGGLCQGYASTTASVNSLIYRHGHCFMYDTELVSALLSAAGFDKIRVASFSELPFQEFLSPGRAAESSYVVAECVASSC